MRQTDGLSFHGLNQGTTANIYRAMQGQRQSGLPFEQSCSHTVHEVARDPQCRGRKSRTGRYLMEERSQRESRSEDNSIKATRSCQDAATTPCQVSASFGSGETYHRQACRHLSAASIVQKFLDRKTVREQYRAVLPTMRNRATTRLKVNYLRSPVSYLQMVSCPV